MDGHAHPELSTTLSLRSGSHSWGTERRMALLAAIGTEGSITAAARKIGMSYKAAWDAIEMMNHASGQPLVERVTGGRSGGGARLTPQARRLLDWFAAVQEEHQKFMQRLAALGPEGMQNFDWMQRLAVQTSARNRFSGVIQALEPRDAVNDQVDIAVGPQPLCAVVTRASTERLGLRPGAPVLAILKAQAVVIHPMASPPKCSGTNQWAGSIVQADGAGHAMALTVEVAPQLHITGLADPKQFTDVPVQPGDPVWAQFQAVDVLLATWD